MFLIWLIRPVLGMTCSLMILHHIPWDWIYAEGVKWVIVCLRPAYTQCHGVLPCFDVCSPWPQQLWWPTFGEDCLSCLRHLGEHSRLYTYGIDWFPGTCRGEFQTVFGMSTNLWFFFNSFFGMSRIWLFCYLSQIYFQHSLQLYSRLSVSKNGTNYAASWPFPSLKLTFISLTPPLLWFYSQNG